MLLIDTSVWIVVFRDRSGEIRQQLETLIAKLFADSLHCRIFSENFGAN